MAKKFFNKKVKQKSIIQTKRKTIITIIIISLCIIGIIICFVITSSFNEQLPDNAHIDLQESVNVEINSELPDKDLFFKSLKGITEDKIDIDFDNVKLDTVGIYEVPIKIYGAEYTSKINVIDITKPTLVTKDLTIESGNTYSVNNFVESCSDNSNEECNIEFYTLGVDQNGEPINYSEYTNQGTYEVKISAKDSSGNEIVNTVQLIIGNGQGSVKCDFGTLEYDESNILSYIAGSNGCAIDLNLYQSDSIRKPVTDIANSETTKIQSELNNISDINDTIVISRTINPILNNTGNGLVGYTLLIEAKDNQNNTIASYYLDINGNRHYIINTYNLK